MRVLSPVLLLLLLAAFGGQSDPEEDDGDGENAEGRPRTGCPANMSRVGDMTCMDRFEAPNVRGGKPLVMQSATDAQAWCERRHKRLCTEDEWIAACEANDHRSYPYGTAHEESRCNDDKPWKAVDENVLARWPAEDAQEHNKTLYQAVPSGSNHGCVSTNGVYDLTCTAD